MSQPPKEPSMTTDVPVSRPEPGPDLFRLDGRVALVTGAGGELASAAALGFARAGASLVITDRDADRLAATARAVEALGASVRRGAIGLRRPGVDRWRLRGSRSAVRPCRRAPQRRRDQPDAGTARGLPDGHLGARHRCQPDRLPSVCQGGRPADDRRRPGRQHHQHQLDRGDVGARTGQSRVRREQGGCRPDDQRTGRRLGVARHPRQLDPAMPVPQRRICARSSPTRNAPTWPIA